MAKPKIYLDIVPSTKLTSKDMCIVNAGVTGNLPTPEKLQGIILTRKGKFIDNWYSDEPASLSPIINAGMPKPKLAAAGTTNFTLVVSCPGAISGTQDFTYNQ